MSIQELALVGCCVEEIDREEEVTRKPGGTQKTRRQFLKTAGVSGSLWAATPSAFSALNPQRQPASEGRYLAAARQFLDTMITRGIDRHGRQATPVFCLSLDPETHAPPLPPEKIDWEYARGFEYLHRDFGYYWKSHLHGSNLIYDQGSIRALNALTEATGLSKYRQAANAYLDFFLDNQVSQQTGIFGWGEHIFYNVFLDHIIGGAFTVRAWRRFSYNHELERWTTIYDLTWERDAEKTRAEIEAIYEYKVLEPESFLNNRHSDFFAGRVSTNVLTFIKHSGLFVHAFAFLYSKTGDPQHLAWAKRMADLFWDLRNPETNLVRNAVQREDEPASSSGMALLALFLLRAHQWHPENLFLERALSYLKAYKRYFLSHTGRFRLEVAVDGTDRKPGQFSEYWEAPIRQAKAAALAYSMSGDSEVLELADIVISHLSPQMPVSALIERSLISAEVEASNTVVSTALDLYELTADVKYLKKAQEFADHAISQFLYRGLFVSRMQLYPEGDTSITRPIYDGRTAAGWLARNLIRLEQHLDSTREGSFKKRDRLDRTGE